MNKRQELGSDDVIKLVDGHCIPKIGLGTFQLTGEVAERAVDVALSAGYRHIDTAFTYGNEKEIGLVLAKWFDAKKLLREDVFITSKLPGIYMGSREHVRYAVQQSLNDLQLTYLDLYLIHTPIGFQLDDKGTLFPRNEDGKMKLANHDLVATWKALEELVKEGKIKSIGVSNFNARQIDLINDAAMLPIAVNQVECHPYLNQAPLRAHCRQRGIFLTAFAPLGSPALARLSSDCDKFSLLDDPTIAEIATKHKRTPAQVVLRYQVQRGVVAVPKSATPAYILKNIQVLKDFHLSEEDMTTLDSLNKNHRIYTFLNFGEDHPEFPFHDAY